MGSKNTTLNNQTYHAIVTCKDLDELYPYGGQSFKKSRDIDDFFQPPFYKRDDKNVTLTINDIYNINPLFKSNSSAQTEVINNNIHKKLCRFDDVNINWDMEFQLSVQVYSSKRIYNKSFTLSIQASTSNTTFIKDNNFPTISLSYNYDTSGVQRGTVQTITQTISIPSTTLNNYIWVTCNHDSTYEFSHTISWSGCPVGENETVRKIGINGIKVHDFLKAYGHPTWYDDNTVATPVIPRVKVYFSYY